MKKILIIEDEEGVRANILELLEVEGFNAIAAENGAIGVQLALFHLPDLIICDVMMPAKRLAELYAGKLTIESLPEQQTTVLVTLPAVLEA